MFKKNMTISTLKKASEPAKELLSSALLELTKAEQAQACETPRLFFPNGIELIFHIDHLVLCFPDVQCGMIQVLQRGLIFMNTQFLHSRVKG